MAVFPSCYATFAFFPFLPTIAKTLGIGLYIGLEDIHFVEASFVKRADRFIDKRISWQRKHHPLGKHSFRLI